MQRINQKTLTNEKTTMRKQAMKSLTLAVVLAVFSSTAAMGQKRKDTEWMKDLTSRITFNGYAQGGWSYQDAGDQKQS